MNNNRVNVTSALDGTKTAENLRLAFEKEAHNFARGSIFSGVAANDGKTSAERTLREQADNDKRLAELWLSYLDEIGDTIENLHELSAIKDALSHEFYPFAAEIAEDEGFEEIAEKMRLAAAAKSDHSTLLKGEEERMTNPDSLYSHNPETPWLCTACGYVVKGNTPPERCPLCSYPASYFVKR